MRKLNLKHRIAAVAIVLLSLFVIGLNSCNNSTTTTETKTDSSKMNKMSDDSTHKDTSGKGEQVPPPK